MPRFQRKLNSVSGLSWLTVILALLVLALAVSIIVPYIKDFAKRAEARSCALALETANRELVTAYLLDTDDFTEEDARAAIRNLDILCPVGGDILLTPTGDAVPYEAVCALHSGTSADRTLHKAMKALEDVERNVAILRSGGKDYPESVPVTVNGTAYMAQLADGETNLRRGTGLSGSYDGTVIYYSIVGHSGFGKDSGLNVGEVWYLSFADEENAVRWDAVNGWTVHGS